MLRRSLPIVVVAAALVIASNDLPHAQTLGGPTVPSWVGSLLMGNDPMMGADPSSPIVTDSLGFKFELFFSAVDAFDPQTRPIRSSRSIRLAGQSASRCGS